MKKLLSALRSSVPSVIRWIGPEEQTVGDIAFDSRKVREGSLFVAVNGTQSDGHAYIGDALRAGAQVIVCQNLPDIQPGITYIQVADSAQALGALCDAFYDHPSSHLQLIGVTGTNGKTTTATLLYKIFRQLGYHAGLLSTVANFIDGEETAATHTTPDAVQLNELLADMVARGCTYCFMGVSSHSIVQQRIAGLKFAGGIFTNLTQDHLDFHKTFDAYLQAKKRFFDQLGPEAFALVNKDDRNGMVMVQNTAAQVKTYAVKGMADFKCKVKSHQLEGMELELNQKDVFVQFIGTFNAYNLTAVYGAATLLGANQEQLLTIMSSLKPVAGRFEYFRSARGFTAIVDYAHTPDAVENVLKTVRQLVSRGQRVITVIGCGGDRDKTKRPIMARTAASYSDLLILTSDNPRSEEPEDIIKDMQAGLLERKQTPVLTIVDRREAIKAACLSARKDDYVLIAGKGHETYQIVKGVKSHFDDREEVLKYI